MNDNMLSQEEINELLSGINSDEEGDTQSAETPPSSDHSLDLTDYLTAMEEDAMGEIGNISFGNAATALSTLLNQKVEITAPELSLVMKNKLENEFPQPHVAVHVKYTAGFEGENILVIKTTDAAIIADLMLGGNGSDPSGELDDMHISAVQEAMNQMMGAASTSMATIFNKKVDISPPSINLLDFKNQEGTENIPEENNLVKISFRLKIGTLIDSSIMQLVTVPFAKGLVKDLMNPGGDYPEEPSQIQPDVMVEPVKEQVSEANEVERHVPVGQPPTFEERGQHIGGLFQQSNQKGVPVQPASFSAFDIPPLSQNESSNLNMLLDIPLEVTVELGRTNRSIQDILEYTPGSIIELDKLAGEPVDILVNKKLIAKGEVVVIDENFGVRIIDIVSQETRIKNLK